MVRCAKRQPPMPKGIAKWNIPARETPFGVPQGRATLAACARGYWLNEGGNSHEFRYESDWLLELGECFVAAGGAEAAPGVEKDVV